MAITREEFFNKKAKASLWDVAVSIKRGNPLPLDADSIFESYAALETYAADVLAYPGQLVAVVEEDSTGIYYLDQNLAIQPVGVIPTGDGKSIEVTAEGAISLIGAADAENGTLPIKEVVQYGFDGNYKNLKTILKIANSSPFTAKINGKIVVPTYNVLYSNIKYIKPLVDKARQEFPNKFYLMAQLDIRPKDVKEYLAKGKVSQDVLNRYKLEISNILSYFDGIQINPAINYTDVNGEYASKFDTSFYMDKILPILKALMANSEYFQLKSLVDEIDPKAFIYTTRANEVHGEGFSYGNSPKANRKWKKN